MVRVSDLDYYEGWGTVGDTHCYGVEMCAMYAVTSQAAWRWSGSGWVRTTRPVGTKVWIAPFAVGWSWTWTSGTGWLAMQDNVLLVKQYYFEL
jgi:hypothetical protein